MKDKNKAQEGEFASSLKLKELEVENKNKALEIELKETESVLEGLKEEKKKIKEMNEELQERISKLEKEILIETAALDSQINKIDNDLEDVRQKVKEKENNPRVEIMQKLFNEVKQYVVKYKAEISKSENIKNLKISLFDLQRKLNDREFENSQAELKIKKELNEELKSFKIAKNEEIRVIEEQVYKAPNSYSLLILKSKIKEYQSEIEDLENKCSKLNKKLEEKQNIIEENNKKIEKLTTGIETTRITEQDLETKIYRLSGDNMMKICEKDDLIIIIPEILLALKRLPNELKTKVQELPDGDTKRYVKSIVKELCK